MDKTYIIGGIRESERSVSAEVITPSGEVKKLRMTPKMWNSYAYSSGDAVGAEVFEAMAADAEKCEAVTKALGYLSDAPHSYKSLAAKLKRCGFSEEAVEASLRLVHKRGLIDEDAQAAAIAEKMATTKYRGPARVRAELMNKGYSAEVSRRAADGVPQEVYDAALRKALAKKCRCGVPTERSERDKVAASLVRSGFTVSHVLGLMDSLGEDEFE